MSAIVRRRHSISSEDYLEGERHSDIRHEYVDGEVYAMAGESKTHNTIALNIAAYLRERLRGSPCRVFMENVKTGIETLRTNRYYYPDVQVACGTDAGERYVERQPRLIVEVLSDSTERLDRADKFFAYRTLESLEEYVLVAQDTRRVEVFRRVGDWNWELHTPEEGGEELRLESVGVVLDLATIYEDVEPVPRVVLEG